MTKVKMLIPASIAVGLLFALQSAQAHCDSLDGPVANADQKALETGNVNPVLAYAPATSEAEIRAIFQKSRKVRDLGTDARALADQAFMETLIRLHRAGSDRGQRTSLLHFLRSALGLSAGEPSSAARSDVAIAP